MLNAKSILSLSIFIIFKLIYTVSTFSRTRQSMAWYTEKQYIGCFRASFDFTLHSSHFIGNLLCYCWLSG